MWSSDRICAPLQNIHIEDRKLRATLAQHARAFVLPVSTPPASVAPHLGIHALIAQRAPAITSSPNAHRNPPRASFRTLSCLDAPTSNIPPSHQHPHTHTRAWRREEESGSADASAACAETHTRVANALAHTHERCQWPRCRGHEEGVILGGAGTGVSRILGQVWQASVLGQEHRQVHRLFAEKLGVSTCSAAFA